MSYEGTKEAEMNSPIEYRYTERTAFCRGCDKPIEKHTEKVIATYSWRNRGQYIYFCQECVNNMVSMMIQDQLTEKELGE